GTGQASDPIRRLATSQSPVFLVNSRHPLLCAPPPWLPRTGAPFSRSYGGILPSSFNTVLSSASVCSTSPPVSVSGTVFTAVLFPGSPRPPSQSSKGKRLPAFVTSARLGNIDPIPIDYGCRPRLRGRLTLRGLTLRRNPWTCGERVSHPLYRYSCQHSHLPYLQHRSRDTFIGLGNAPLPLAEDRRQTTVDRRPIPSVRSRPASSGAIPAASWRAPDIRPATVATSAHRYSQDQGNSGATPAFPRSTRSPSPGTA